MNSFRLIATCTAALLSGAGLFSLVPAAYADDATDAPVETEAPASAGQPDISATNTYRFRELGANYPLALRGVDGINSIHVDTAENEQVVGARLKLRYQHSPELLDGLSHLKVAINGEHTATLPLKAKQAGKEQERVVELPPELFTDYSEINLQLIGHYTLGCEDPRHPSLWLTVDHEDSELELDVVYLDTQNNLSSLPLPFFDARDQRPLTLPFVFAGTPDKAELQAAGAIASWFGALADYRGANFPVLQGQLPASGNAIVLINTAKAAGNLPVAPAASAGPVISIINHPGNPTGKLLLVQGSNDAELLAAARTLATSAAALSGTSARIDQARDLAPRKPYDAPKWIPTDRPVSFGEIATPASMAAEGFSPDYIRLNLGLPPDLYSWRGQEVPLDLHYRYMPRANSGKSVLNVQVNSLPLASLPIPSVPPATSLTGRLAENWNYAGDMPARAELMIPVDQLAAQSQLDFHFNYEFISRGACKDTLFDFMRSRIDPESTIDISDLPHFIAMPNMAAFGNGGYPFTRMADLSETAIALPAHAGNPEFEAYLTLLGHFGAITGYPATHVTAVTPDELSELKHKDILILSSGPTDQMLGDWQRYLPIDPAQALKPGASSASSSWWSSIANWFDSKEEAAEEALTPPPSPQSVVVTGFQSPLNSDRSVVVMAAPNAAALSQATSALHNDLLLKKLSGSSLIIDGEYVTVLEDRSTYHVGQLGWFRHTQWFLERHILLATIISLLASLVAGILLYISFRARAQRRLQNQDREE